MLRLGHSEWGDGRSREASETGSYWKNPGTLVALCNTGVRGRNGELALVAAITNYHRLGAEDNLIPSRFWSPEVQNQHHWATV